MSILVIGDIMLDINYIGTSNRLAPEAPLPVIKVSKVTYQIGGGGNVLKNLLSLGIKSDIMTVVGNDEYGNMIEKKLEELKVNTQLLIKDNSGRKTTIKHRVFKEEQIVGRFDIETVENIDVTIVDEIMKKLEKIIDQYDMIVLSDYLKGVLTHDLTVQIIDLCNKKNKITIVDPKDPDYSKYKNSTIIKPNKNEAHLILNREVKLDMLKNDTLEILQKINSKICILTLSEMGLAINDGETFLYEKIDNKINVIDVTGAGDCVLSGFCYYYLRTKDIFKSAHFANYCGQTKVRYHGTYTLTKYDAINYQHHKLINNNDQLLEIKEAYANKKIIFTNGCFDVLHYGHLTYLEEAKKMGDILIVGLNTDESIKKNKGESRPYNCLKYRIKQLECLTMIDYIIVFDEPTPLNIIKILRPQFLVKGADYAVETIIGKEYAQETVVIKYIDGVSSTKLINLLNGGNNSTK